MNAVLRCSRALHTELGEQVSLSGQWLAGSQPGEEGIRDPEPDPNIVAAHLGVSSVWDVSKQVSNQGHKVETNGHATYIYFKL